MQTFSVKSGAKVRVSKLEKIQKRAMRCIDLNLHSSPVNNVTKGSELFKL